MIATESIQGLFLEHLRKKLNPNLSFVDEIAESLHISKDSAYRRIRGETILSLDEVRVLCIKYDVSIDSLINQENSGIIFHSQSINHTDFTFKNWLKTVRDYLTALNTHQYKELIYLAKDVPVFYYFEHPELSAFKMFFWLKTLLRDPQLANEKFRMDCIPREMTSLGLDIWKQYAKVPSTEIWSFETFQVTLKQIEYYHDCGFFAETKDALKLCDAFMDMNRAIQEMAARGFKNKNSTSFKLYKNDILTADNTVLLKMSANKTCFITYGTMNLLTTSNKKFCKQIEDHLENLHNKSVLISTTGEKERSKLFNSIEQSVKNMKAKMAI